MQVLWRLLLAGRVKSPARELSLYGWGNRLKRDGPTATLRLELRELLSPKILLRKRTHTDEQDESTEEPLHIRELVDWELVLAADDVRYFLRELPTEPWRSALPAFLDDFQQLLRDALDLLREVGEADDESDRSHWDLPSISPHWQNREFRDWVGLVELLRDSWLATHERDVKRARRIAIGWFEVPYPTFKRLALFAASQDEVIGSARWVGWLVSREAWWLWATDTRRETMRLLVQQGKKLSASARDTLERAILAGPPRRMYRENLEAKRWGELVDHSVWLLLAKLRQGGGRLGERASERFSSLSLQHPQWKLASDEQDEFSFWMSGSGDPDYEASHQTNIAPRKRGELVRWLKQAQPSSFFYEDTWREICRTRFFHSYFALCDLAQENLWLTERWRTALQAWSEEGLISRSWRYAAPLVLNMPDRVVQENVHSVTWWTNAASKSIDRHEGILLDLCRRLLSLILESGSGTRHRDETVDDFLAEAINHPIGHVVQTLLNFWFKRGPNDNDLLPEEIKALFTKICDPGIDIFRHGRVLLASRLIALFRVDRSWTEQHLLPLFDWSRSSVEAKAAWEGFLWSPRLHRPLLAEFKSQFLSTAFHYQDLGEHRGQFAAFLTYAALDPVEAYSLKDFQTAIDSLPQQGLHEVARTLAQALEGAGEQREEYWINRIQPFWHNVWPKSRDRASDNIAQSLARLSIAAGGQFPEALAAIVDWLRPIEHPGYILRKLHGSQLTIRFPEHALRLLDAIVLNQPWTSEDLHRCLMDISQARPDLQQQQRYQRLAEFAQQRGN
ncbi:hypothetical protein [Bradyrhizobium sp. USDA 4451]